MMRPPNTVIYIILAMGLALDIFFFGGRILHATNPTTGSAPDAAALARQASDDCDRLASQPNDANRFAPPVSDEQLATGAAIEACSRAVRLNPSLPRAWFEFGRALWSGHRDREAFRAFLVAERYHYAPALKYIGDAYLETRGLPSGQERHAGWRWARYWYDKSGQLGFPDAEKAVKEIDDYVRRNTLDSTPFQCPEFIEIMYRGDFARLENDQPRCELFPGPLSNTKINFIIYVNAFIDTLEHHNAWFINIRCPAAIQQVGTMANNFAEFLLVGGSILQSLQDKSFTAAASAFVSENLTKNIYASEGEKDALLMMDTYKCESAVGQKIVRHVNLTVPQIKAALGLR